MSATIEANNGVGLFAANDNHHPEAERPAAGIDPSVLQSLDVALFRCLRRLGKSRDLICAALLITTAEYDYVDAMI